MIKKFIIAAAFTMATAFGPEGMVLIHLLAEIAPQTPIFNLDTGYNSRKRWSCASRSSGVMASPSK